MPREVYVGLDIGAYQHHIPLTYTGGDPTFDALLHEVSPWGIPCFVGMRGAGRDGATHILTGFDWPAYSPTVQGKTAQQGAAIDAFRKDLERAVPRPREADAAVEPNPRQNDPPDFYLTDATGRFGLDVTQLTLQSRRKVHSIFAALREEIDATADFDSARLRGHLVYVWFPSKRGISAGGPTRELRRLLVRELQRLERPDRTKVAPAGFAGDNPPFQAHRIGSQCTIYAIPVDGEPPTPLWQKHGFELGLVYSQAITRTAALRRIHECISSHDKEEIESLVITAGAFDERGMRHQTDHQLAELVLASRVAIDPPRHIKRVWLHCAMTGRIVDLFPGAHPGVLPDRPAISWYGA